MFILTDLTDMYVLESISSWIANLDIFWFDFMLVKPRDVLPMFCFNVQTNMIFLLQQLLHQTFYNAYPLEKGKVLSYCEALMFI